MSRLFPDDLKNFRQTGDPGIEEGAYTLGPLQAGPPCCEPRPLIRVEHLSLHYGEKPALEEVTLELYRGCITALIGPSGCGKTSFLSVLNRLTDLIPGCRVAGRVRIGAIDLLHPALDVQALRREVGMIFQKPVPFPLSIRRNIELPLRERGVTRQSELDRVVEQVLTDVGLWQEVKDRLVASALTLSGGQQQRLCIARALALEPGILLMDEPCSALDPIASGVVEDLIQRLGGRYTVVIVTHNLAQARRIANYAGFFWVKERAGRLIEFGQCRQIFESPRHNLTAAYVSGERG
ncbi:MAG: phosphate ABC transporter ATP-binding protein [Methylococcales bacterium]